MNRLISPILYTLCIAVNYSVLLVLAVMLGIYDIHWIHIAGFIIIAILLFWIENMFIQKINPLRQPFIRDHFHQNAIYYPSLLIVTYLAVTLFPTRRYGMEYIHIIITAILIILAIKVNALFLIIQYRRTRNNSLTLKN